MEVKFVTTSRFMVPPPPLIFTDVELVIYMLAY